MNRRELLKAAAAAAGAGRALEFRIRASAVADAQYHHDRAVSGRRPGRSRGAAGGAGAGENSRQARHRRQPRRRRRRIDRQRGGGARRARWLHAADDAVVAGGAAGSRPAVRPPGGLRSLAIRAGCARARRSDACSRCRLRRRGRRCRISSTTPKSDPAKFPTARRVPTARCMWRWKCSRPAPASNCCTCRSAAPAPR